MRSPIETRPVYETLRAMSPAARSRVRSLVSHSFGPIDRARGRRRFLARRAARPSAAPIREISNHSSRASRAVSRAPRAFLARAHRSTPLRASFPRHRSTSRAPFPCGFSVARMLAAMGVGRRARGVAPTLPRVGRAGANAKRCVSVEVVIIARVRSIVSRRRATSLGVDRRRGGAATTTRDSGDSL